MGFLIIFIIVFVFLAIGASVIGALITFLGQLLMGALIIFGYLIAGISWLIKRINR